LYPNNSCRIQGVYPNDNVASEDCLILATGGTGLVKAAYSSGNPAIGVGPGNVPVFIDVSADIPFAISNIIISKAFDMVLFAQ